MEKRQPLFCECAVCGERWKIATAPVSINVYANALKRAVCPNCGESKALYACSTTGPDAPTGPRHGRNVK